MADHIFFIEGGFKMFAYCNGANVAVVFCNIAQARVLCTIYLVANKNTSLC